MKLGTLTPSFRLGGNTPSRIYRGSNLVFLNPLSLSPALWLSDTGSDLAQWEDLSGNGRHAVQATPANRPSIVSAALNGRQVRRFNGSSQFLTQGYRGIFSNVPGATVFVVHKSTSGGSSERPIFQNLVPSSQNARLFFGVDSPSKPSGWFYGGRRLNADGGDFNFSDITYSTGSFYAVTVQHRYSSAQKQMWINGASSSLDTSFQTAGNTNTGDSTVDTHIGKNANSAIFFQGDIAEILVFQSALSTADRQAVETYLNAKWAIY